MSILKYMDRLKHMDDLIRRMATGKPDEFAEKLGICKSMLMLNLKEMKKLGAPIHYNSNLNTYYYIKPCKLNFEFELNEAEMQTLRGGQNIFNNLSHSNNIRIAFYTFDPQGFKI